MTISEAALFLVLWGEPLFEEAFNLATITLGKSREEVKPGELTIAAIGILYRRNLIQKPEHPNTSQV